MRTFGIIMLCILAVIGSGSVASAEDRDAISREQHRNQNCHAKLESFIADIDDILEKSPRTITQVYAIFYRYFPFYGCEVDVVSRIVKTSKYFQSESMNGPKIHVFRLGSDTATTSGIMVSFGLSPDTGELLLPFAMWWPPLL
jgi:hypothetical protein